MPPDSADNPQSVPMEGVDKTRKSAAFERPRACLSALVPRALVPLAENGGVGQVQERECSSRFSLEDSSVAGDTEIGTWHQVWREKHPC